ncbi:MAG TPA: hypothetical protein VIE66_18925 [Methylocella sp.]|jgi:hypothetical protein
MTLVADEATKKQVSDCHVLKNHRTERSRKYPGRVRGKGPCCSLCGVDMTIVQILLVSYLLSPLALVAVFGIVWIAGRLYRKVRTLPGWRSRDNINDVSVQIRH